MIYGLQHCPYSKSYAHKSDSNLLVLSHYDDQYGFDTLDYARNVHSVNTLCGFEVINQK